MIIVMKKGASKEELAEVKKRIKELGYKPHVIHGETRNVVGAVGDERGKAVLQSIESMPGVENVVPILKPYKLASKEVKPEPTAVEIAPGLSDRWRQARRHGRPLFGRERGADSGDGPCGQSGRARPCCAVALSSRGPAPILSRAWRRMAEAAGHGPRRNRSADRHRSGQSA